MLMFITVSPIAKDSGQLRNERIKNPGIAMSSSEPVIHLSIPSRPFAQLCNGLEAGIFAADDSGVILYVNTVISRLLKADAEALAGKALESIMHPGSPSGPDPLRVSIEAQGVPVRIDFQDCAGTPVPGYLRTIPVQHKRAQRPAVIGIVEPVGDAQLKPAGRQAGLFFKEAYREEKEFLDAVIEHSIDSIVISDHDGVIQRVNRAFINLIGKKQTEIVGRPHDIVFSVERGTYHSAAGEQVSVDSGYIAAVGRNMKKLTQEGRLAGWVHYLMCADNTLVPVEHNMTVLFDGSGKKLGTVSIFRDITTRRQLDRKLEQHQEHLNELVARRTAELTKANRELVAHDQELRAVNYQLMAREQQLRSANEQLTASNQQLIASEQALRESEERFRAVVKTAHESIITASAEGKILSWNNGARDIFGYEEDEVLGKSVLMLAPERNRPIHQLKLNELDRTDALLGFEQTAEGYGLKKNGTEFPLEFSLSQWSTNNTVFYAFIVRDITQRKKAENDLKALNQQLQRSEQKYRQLVETMNEGLMIRDRNDLFSFVNAPFCSMLGYESEELIGKPVSGFLTEAGRKILSEQIALRREGGSAAYEISWICKTGKEIVTRVSPRALSDDTGAFAGSLAVITDITKSKEMEKQLLQAEKLRSLGELAGGVAHDFNNVLAAVLGRAQYLKKALEKMPDAGGAESVLQDLARGIEIIEHAALDGAETVRRIQEFSRRRAEDRQFQDVDVKHLIDGAIEFTKARWKDEAESRGVTYTLANRIPKLPRVAGSASELREVLTNLIHNALDAMPDGGTLTLEGFCNGQRITISLHDEGSGIDPEIYDRIFDPFFTTKGPRSTGLGLSVSYGIISRHGGTIRCEKGREAGTTFSIELPVSGLHKNEHGPPPAPHARTGAPLSILIIDDEKAVRDLLSDILAAEGHRTETAADGDEGLRLFSSRGFDMVFTDLGMPGMSGWQVAEQIKKIDSDTPVVLITGWETDPAHRDHKNGVVDQVVQKPFQINHVMRTLDTVVKRYAGRGGKSL